MALLPELGDTAFWCRAIKADAEFRACLEQVVGNLEIAIDVPALEASFSLSAAIDLQIESLQARLDAIVDELPCIDVIIDFLEGELNADAVAWRATMLAQRSLLLAEQATLEGTLAILPAFSLSTGEQTDNLITTGKNSSFLGGILDNLESACEEIE